MQQSDGTENDGTGRGTEVVEVCRAIVVYQPLNLILKRRALSICSVCQYGLKADYPGVKVFI